MTPAAALGPWANFYIVTGSASAGLTGLMFVVITLVMQGDRPTSRDGIDVFSTPTVMHFGAALFVSAVLVAPWPSLVTVAAVIGATGLGGLAYVARVTHRTRKLETYRPDFEDWISYTILPFVDYALLAAGAVALPTHPDKALFAIATGVVLLIFMGIRNAWDVVTYIAIGNLNAEQSPDSNGDSLS